MPWLDPERVGPFDVRPYLYGLGVLAFPSFAILGAVFFALASRVRHVMAIYVALVALLVAYFAASAMFGDLESRGSRRCSTRSAWPPSICRRATGRSPRRTPACRRSRASCSGTGCCG